MFLARLIITIFVLISSKENKHWQVSTQENKRDGSYWCSCEYLFYLFLTALFFSPAFNQHLIFAYGRGDSNKACFDRKTIFFPGIWRFCREIAWKVNMAGSTLCNVAIFNFRVLKKTWTGQPFFRKQITPLAVVMANLCVSLSCV